MYPNLAAFALLLLLFVLNAILEATQATVLRTCCHTQQQRKEECWPHGRNASPFPCVQVRA